MGAVDGKPLIGFFGIGLMGKPMAINLLKAGFPLIAWNRTTAKAADLAAYGAQVAQTAEDAAKADVLITMLAAGPGASGSKCHREGNEARCAFDRYEFHSAIRSAGNCGLVEGARRAFH